MNGKEKCRILKEIRQQIARENDIDLVIEECTHRGECRGTCPRCEAEVQYLERELEKRRRLQKRVSLAGVSAGVALALSGCVVVERLADNLPLQPRPTEEIVEMAGMVPMEPQPTDDVLILDGEVGPEDFYDYGDPAGDAAAPEDEAPEAVGGN